MPKPLKKVAPKKPSTPKKGPSSDPVLRAKQQLDEHMAKFATSAKPWDAPSAAPEPVAPSFEEQLSAHMSKLGTKGGKVSGARRMTNLTSEQRQDIALKAARARWAKRKKAV